MTATERHLRALEGIYRRRDRGETTGRNATATDRTLDRRWRQLREALEAGGFEELDANPTLATRYSRLERRHLA